MADKCFIKITNKDIYDKLENIEKNIDKISETAKWAKRTAYAAMAVACFAVTVAIAYGGH